VPQPTRPLITREKFLIKRHNLCVAELKLGLLIEVAWRAQNIFTGLCRGGTVVLSDRDLIGVQFTYVGGHVCEVIGWQPLALSDIVT
jgi:hypothetical protein